MRVGCTPQDVGFPPTLRACELVDLVRAHYRDPLPRDEVLERFGLELVSARQAGGLSGGQRRRLGLALAFAGRPEAVFLDEPTTGLDVESRLQFWSLIRDQSGAGTTVLLTTHYLEEANALATRVAVLHEGVIVADGSPEEIRREVGLTRITFAAGPVPGLEGVDRHTYEAGRTTLWVEDAEPVVRGLIERNVPLRDLEVVRPSLEQAFLQLTRDAP
jgi:ABC-2 type transport system ATP-binding protein